MLATSTLLQEISNVDKIISRIDMIGLNGNDGEHYSLNNNNNLDCSIQMIFT